VNTRILLFILLTFITCRASAQVISFKDTVVAYNKHRLNINRTGMKVLGSWGIVNIAGSGAGYFAAKQDEWKYFHEMNVLWGVVNTGIAAFSLARVRKEMRTEMGFDQAYGHYKSDKKIYLINAGLDVLYIGTGVALTALSQNAKKTSDAAILKGFGRSIAVQGVFLLLFDNIMFSIHHRSNSKWFQLMNEIHVSGSGIGFIHSF
jgi:hypothetical protein